jgi:hypothetical protein
MAKATRRRSSPKQHFVIAKLNDSTVLAGWCVPIKDKQLAMRVESLRASPRKIAKLASAFAANGEKAFATALGTHVGIGVRLHE